MCFKHSHIFVDPDCGTHKGDGACVDTFLSIRIVEPTKETAYVMLIEIS
jgi:hypothetical protein